MVGGGLIWWEMVTARCRVVKEGDDVLLVIGDLEALGTLDGW